MEISVFEIVQCLVFRHISRAGFMPGLHEYAHSFCCASSISELDVLFSGNAALPRCSSIIYTSEGDVGSGARHRCRPAAHGLYATYLWI